MRNLMGKMKLIAILAITALLVVIAVLNLRDRLSPKYLPDDGIEWVDTENGVQVHKVRADSPLAFVIKKDDYLRVLFYNGKFEEVKHSEDVYRYLNRLGVGADARYVIEREDPVLQSLYGIDVPLYDADFKIVGRSHIQITAIHISADRARLSRHRVVRALQAGARRAHLPFLRLVSAIVHMLFLHPDARGYRA
jgi:hypothetical protein